MRWSDRMETSNPLRQLFGRRRRKSTVTLAPDPIAVFGPDDLTEVTSFAELTDRLLAVDGEDCTFRHASPTLIDMVPDGMQVGRNLFGIGKCHEAFRHTYGLMSGVTSSALHTVVFSGSSTVVHSRARGFFEPSVKLITQDGSLAQLTDLEPLYESDASGQVRVTRNRLSLELRDEIAVPVCGVGFHNYGHFLYDGLPAALMYKQALPDAPLRLVGGHLAEWQCRLMDSLGLLDRYRVVEQPVCFSRVLTSNLLSSHVPYPTRFVRPVFDTLRFLLSGAKQQRDRTVFFSRGSDTTRRVLTNRLEVERALTAEGVEIIQPETLSVPEQVALAAGSSFIIGESGAGLANIGFCDPGAAVLEIQVETIPDIWTRAACRIMGLHWHLFVAQTDHTATAAHREPKPHAIMTIDVPSLVEAVRTIKITLSRRAPSRPADEGEVISFDNSKPEDFLQYGFNEPENGFVWSTFAFGMRFSPKARRVLLSAHYVHEHGTLLVHNKRTSSRSYRLHRGVNQLVVTYDEADTLCHFALSPRRALPTDVRELGLMLCSVRTVSDASPLARDPEANEGTPDTWNPPTHLPTNRALAQNLLESFIGAGFVLACIESHVGVPRLEFALYLPPWERPGVTATVHVSINGKFFRVLARQTSNTSDFALSHVPNIAYRGTLSLDDFLDQDNGIVPLDIFLSDTDGKERFPYQSFHWRGFGIGDVPSPEHIFRVAGPASLNWMLLTGATWYVKLVLLYENLTGRSIDTCGPILDWGVGCARIARFFPEHLRDRVIGVDIDSFNIGWCRESVPGIAFDVTSPSPPLPFADGTFELVYGHSVITHLSEQDQHAWLRELTRVTRPDGHCLLTVLNEVSWFTRYYPDHRTPDSIAEFMEKGFVDDGSLDVGVDAAEPGTYRNVSHTTPYIWRVWSEYFDVVSVIQNFADLQSLVVLRRRGIV
jgi:capsular polysaccharide biosynthesis protein/SAM-dependent methyltransferase